MTHTPPVPAPRTKIRQRMNSSSAAGNSSSISDAPSSTSHTRKPKSIHPWMTLVHPGPWSQLPPAPAPVTPPPSWFKPRVPPRNPFGEPRPETKPSSINADDDDQQNDSPGAPAPVGSSDADNTTSRSDRRPASAERPIPPERQEASEGTQTQPAPASDSTQRDEPTGSSSPSTQRDEPTGSSSPSTQRDEPTGSSSPSTQRDEPTGSSSPSTQRDEPTGSSSPSGIGRTADKAANAPPAANTVSSTEVTPGVFHFSGTVRGDPESEGVASGPGMPEWNGAGLCLGPAVGFEPDFEEVTSGVEVPDLGGLSNRLGVSDLAGAVGGVPSLAGAVSGVPSLAGAVSGVPSLAGVVSGVPSLAGVVGGVPSLSGVVSEVPSLAGVAGLPHLSDVSGVGIPDMADLGALGAPDLAGAGNPFDGLGGLEVPDLAGAGNPFEVPDLSEAAGRLGIPDLGGENGMGALGLGDLAAASGGLGEFDGKGGLGGLEVPDLAGGALSGVVAGESPSDAVKTLLPLTKSVSVPAIFSSLPQGPSMSNDGLPEASKACKENPFDRKPGMPKSKTFQTGTPSPKPKRSTAPGYGFPLIKRKVQTDSVAPVEDLEVEMGQLDKQVETLDLKGMELEKRLRNCQKDEDEEKMLIDWLTLVREKNVLVRRDTELVYLSKQQLLEVRQSDVEYGLRCLLNKPESDWSQEDRGREQNLMDELVTIIEQRNHIISSLDQDRQSEREEDLLFEAMMKRKDFQKEGLKELKKSKGKFKLMKVMRMLSLKSETAKDSKDKKKS